MTNQAHSWLKQTILWQRFILIFIGLAWLSSFFAFLSLFFSSYIGAGSEIIISMLIGAGSFVWIGYVFYQLFQNIQETRAFLETNNNIHWQEAMQYQRNFWKHLCLMMLVGFCLFILLIAFIFILFTNT